MTSHTERIERNPHLFWLNTCAVDTYRRGVHHALLHDLHWSAFTPEGGLVCTAQALVDWPLHPPVVSVYLILVGELSKHCRNLAAKLGVEFKERVVPCPPLLC